MKTNYLGFYNKRCTYVVIRVAPMKGINTGAVTTVDIEVVYVMFSDEHYNSAHIIHVHNM